MTTPTHDDPSAAPAEVWRAPVARIALVVLGVTLAIGSLAAGLAWIVSGSATSPTVAAAGAGAGAALAGAFIGLFPIALAIARAPFALALLQVIGSSTRMLAGAGVAVALILAFDLDPFWTLGTLLAAMLAALGAELMIIFPVLTRPASTQTPEAPTGAPEPA